MEIISIFALTIWLNNMVKEKDLSTETRILKAAKEVFVAKGMAGARMQDIADQAGINKALLHYYFRSKEKLFEVIFSETTRRFIPKINEIISSEISLYEKIEAFATEYIDNVIENPFLPIFVINELHKQPEDFVKNVWCGHKPEIGKFVIQMQKAIDNKEIIPIHPAQLIMNILSLCIFPFIGKPILQLVSGVNDQQFLELMKERKKLVPEFIIRAIKI